MVWFARALLYSKSAFAVLPMTMPDLRLLALLCLLADPPLFAPTTAAGLVSALAL